MGFEVHVLASGSDGNCSVLVNGDRAVMIDCGLSYKKIDRLMSLSGIDPSMIEGILITHEHGDHIGGAKATARKLMVPVICNRATFNRSGIEGVNYSEIRMMNTFQIAGMDVISLPTSHHAVDPCCYFFTVGDKKFLYVTDTGKTNFQIEHALEECDLAVIESNYDPIMLRDGPYAPSLKAEIFSEVGHLSNIDCGNVIKKTQTDKKRKFFLAHLSKTNNTPDIARETVAEISGIRRSMLDCLETPAVEDDTRVIKL